MSRMRLFIVVFALGAAACGSTAASTTAPTTQTTITDTYGGTLNQNGGASFSFVTSQSGNVSAAITLLEPDATLLVGLGLGTWNGTACQVVLANDKATLNSFIVGAADRSGNLCVRVYDVGKVVDPILYEIQVTHY